VLALSAGASPEAVDALGAAMERLVKEAGVVERSMPVLATILRNVVKDPTNAKLR
jgi:hypothetical protein